MARQKRKNWSLFESKETYRRSASKERNEAKAKAREDATEQSEIQRDYAYETGARHKRDGRKPLTSFGMVTTVGAERALGKMKATSLAARSYKAGYRNNPAESGRQYRLAQAVLSGSNKLKGMTKQVAQEIIDATPAKMRSLFAKGNPEDAAGELAEAFTGRPADKAMEFTKTVHYHSVLSGLAPLMQIKVWVDDRHVQAINFDKERTWLGSSESGEQMYVEGDDQQLDLDAFGITGHAAQKDLIPIGNVYSVMYFTAKFHLGKADKTPGPYEHIFSEHGEEEPELLYDRLNEEVQFAGGEYHIPIDIDGKYSSGINN